MIFCGSAQSVLAQNPSNYITAGTHIGGYHIKCNGQSTGFLFAHPSFGQAPYTFLWNTGETTAEIKDKPAGVYIVTMTDSLNTSHIDTFELRQPYALGYQSTLSDFYGFNIDVHGGHRGSIQLEATGGTPPYRYLWNNGDSIANRSSLTAGSYTFTITDANQCSSSGSVTLTEPDPIQINFTNVQNLKCFKSYDGKATLTITGGLGNYSVTWDNGSFSMSPDDLPAGFNAVRIYEQGNAVIDTGITLTQPDYIDIQFTMSNYNGFNVSCVDCFNGTVNTTVNGGTAPYSYLWDNVGNSTTLNLSNLNGGNYNLTVTDANGCNASNTATLSMPIPKDWSRTGNANIDTSEFIGSTDSSAVVFKTNSQENLRITGNGKIGIGTAAPTERLEVNGTIKANGFKMGNLNLRYTNATSSFPERIDWGRNDAVQAPYGGPLFPSTCFDPFVVETANIFNGGAVYKVKSIIQNALDCKNDDPTMYVGLYGCDGAIEVNQFDNYTNKNKLLINTLCGKDVIVGKANSGNLIANYRLGVGVASPNEKFEVNGNSILNGNVRIGNDNSTVNDTKLAVEGIIYAREMKVTQGVIWPDYVFKKSYKLPSLKETERYIKQNGHLPEIPAASAIEKNGLSIGEMLTLQMKKIEELTLYIIEQQKELEYLKGEVIKLKK